ncbi:MAG: SDR family oxidoreductase [Actinomycetota bacterium]|nr:SDR family oxidoreductase [Actinomycetota bacterium]
MLAEPSDWSVIVTGGSSGLGAAVVRALSAAGASVVPIDQRPAEHQPSVEADLSDTAAATAATEQALELLGQRLDAVVCCAGMDVPGALAEVDAELWDRIVAVNLFGTAAVIRTAVPHLEASHGRIVTVASTLGHRAVGDATAYCASKFGVVGFTRALTAELRGKVGVTLLTPGGMSTAFFDDRDEQYRPGPDAVLADPDHIAASVVWCLGRPAGIEVRELAVMSEGETSWP